MAAWKLQVRQQRQLRGVIHHQMHHWNRPVAAAPTAGHDHAGGEASGGSGTPPAAGSPALMDRWVAAVVGLQLAGLAGSLLRIHRLPHLIMPSARLPR